MGPRAWRLTFQGHLRLLAVWMTSLPVSPKRRISAIFRRIIMGFGAPEPVRRHLAIAIEYFRFRDVTSGIFKRRISAVFRPITTKFG